MAKKTGLAEAISKKEVNPEAWINEKPQTTAEKASRLVVDIPADLHRQLKGKCGAEGKKIKDVVQSLIEQYLAEQL